MAARSLTLSAFAARRLPDEDVFARTLRGDPVAFSEVYRRYQKRVYGYCLARSLDPNAAADATQEVFMRLLRAEPGSIEKPRAWVFSVARNVCIDAIRKHSRVDCVDDMPDETAALGVAAARDPADVVLSKAEGRDAFLALGRLNPRYRTALILRDVHGQSSRDIGEALNTTPGAVDTLVSRARDAFGAAYAGVLGLPATCRANVELIYRRIGSGISAAENEALEAHLGQCDRCRREAKKAAKPGRLAALLPFLVPARSLGRNALLRASAIAGQSLPEAAQQAAATAAQPHTVGLATKLAAALAAAAIVAVPVVGGVTARSRHHAPHSAPTVARDATATVRDSSETVGMMSAPRVRTARTGRMATTRVIRTATTDSMISKTTSTYGMSPTTTTRTSTTMTSPKHDTYVEPAPRTSTSMPTRTDAGGSTSGATSGQTGMMSR